MKSLLRFKPAWIRRERLLDLLYVFSDAAAVWLAYALTFDRRIGSAHVRAAIESIPGVAFNQHSPWFFGGRIWGAWHIAALLFLCLAFYGLYGYLNMYHGYRMLRRPHAKFKILCVNLAVMGLIHTVLVLTRNSTIPRSYLPVFFFLNTALTIAFRSSLRRLMRFVRRHTDRFDSPVFMIGRTPHADDICAFIKRYRPHGNWIAAHTGSSIVRNLDLLRRRIEDNRIRTVIIADTAMPLDDVMNVIELTAELGNVSCTVVTPHLSVLPLKAGVPCSMVRGVPCVYFDAMHSVFKDTFLRRAASRLAAAGTLVVLSPFLLGVAALVRLTSPGPALFKQRRYGINRRTFTMFKFRTMYQDAEARLASLESQNKMGRGGLFKMAHDPRITPIGHTLRRYSIDELPQFLNVLRGDMRFVGPRPLPERDYRNYYRDWHYGRHLGHPGLTCLWQVSGRSDIDFPSMCILDLYYIRNNSWALDLSILFRTVAVIVNGKGAY